MAMRGEIHTVDGTDTHVIDEGAGPPIVLLHGAALGVDAEVTWHRTLDVLADRFRLIAFDQVGFGHSAMPDGSRYRNRLERVPHAAAVLDHLGVSEACVVGHSEGAFMAARLAITRPELARGLVLVATGGTAPYLGGDADDAWIAAAEAAYNDQGGGRGVEGHLATCRILSRHVDADLEARLRANHERAVAAGQDVMFANLPESETDYRRYGDLQNEYVLPFLPDLEIPALLIWGADDPTVPVERGVRLRDRFRDARLLVVDDSSHNVMLDQPEAFSAAVASFAT